MLKKKKSLADWEKVLTARVSKTRLIRSTYTNLLSSTLMSFYIKLLLTRIDESMIHLKISVSSIWTMTQYRTHEPRPICVRKIPCCQSHSTNSNSNSSTNARAPAPAQSKSIFVRLSHHRIKVNINVTKSFNGTRTISNWTMLQPIHCHSLHKLNFTYQSKCWTTNERHPMSNELDDVLLLMITLTYTVHCASGD